MDRLNPVTLFELVAKDFPADLHQQVFVAGSLAAAYAFKTQLEGGGVNTKDADLVVHPAGETAACVGIAKELLWRGWWRVPGKCYPAAEPSPAENLRAIRLYPPQSDGYFIELLGLPASQQVNAKEWTPVELDDGWYGVPTFRFMGLLARHRIASHAGIEHAAPAEMALANLLSHPRVTDERVSEAIVDPARPADGRKVRRSAKDLGRVLALARLAGRQETETWLDLWAEDLVATYPDEAQMLANRAGTGLRELLDQRDALDDALHANHVGLLAGLGVTADNLRATGNRLVLDVLEPLPARVAETLQRKADNP